MDDQQKWAKAEYLISDLTLKAFMLSFIHGNSRNLQHSTFLDLSRNISKLFGLDFGLK